MVKREPVRRLRARGIVQIEDPEPFWVLAWKLSLIKDEVRLERREEEPVHRWPPAFLERRPLLIVPMVAIPWIFLLGLIAADTSFRLPVITAIILAVYSLRLIGDTFDP
jgi:hypothetical protein